MRATNSSAGLRAAQPSLLYLICDHGVDSVKTLKNISDPLKGAVEQEKP